MCATIRKLWQYFNPWKTNCASISLRRGASLVARLCWKCQFNILPPGVSITPAFQQFIHKIDKRTKFPLIKTIMLHIVMDKIIFKQEIDMNHKNGELFNNC